MDDNCSHVVNLSSVLDLYDINENTFIVWNGNNKSDTWKVYYFDDNPSECECSIFLSSTVRFNIYYSFLKLYFFSTYTLLPIW